MDFGRFRSGNKDAAWLDWLSDDNSSDDESLRTRMVSSDKTTAQNPVATPGGSAEKSSATKSTNDTTDKTVSIHISISGLGIKQLIHKAKKSGTVVGKHLRTRFLRLSIAQRSLLISVVVLLAASVLARPLITTTVTGKGGGSSGGSDILSKTPTFQTLNAASATNKRYDSQKKVVSFTDQIGDVPVTVSQQALPANFQDNTDAKVKKLAEGFTANTPIKLADGGVAYLGTSIKGPQTVILWQEDVLVFIQSAAVIDNDSWATYIDDLY